MRENTASQVDLIKNKPGVKELFRSWDPYRDRDTALGEQVYKAALKPKNSE